MLQKSLIFLQGRDRDYKPLKRPYSAEDFRADNVDMTGIADSDLTADADGGDLVQRGQVGSAPSQVPVGDFGNILLQKADQDDKKEIQLLHFMEDECERFIFQVNNLTN
jgi:hypothetical protein